MNNERRHVGCGRRLLLWLLPPLSLVLVGNSQTRRPAGATPRLYTPRGYLGDREP